MMSLMAERFMIMVLRVDFFDKPHSRTPLRCRSILPPAPPLATRGWPTDPIRWLRDIAGFQAHKPCEFSQE
jgi:hypothetical protein